MSGRRQGSARLRQVTATAHYYADRYSSRAQRFVRRPRPMIESYLARRFPRQQRPNPRPPGATIPPIVALRENGFTVARGLLGADECRAMAAALKSEAGIRDGERFSCFDATLRVPGTRRLLLDARILDAVRSAIGPDARFLQVADLHHHHDAGNWHRDSVHGDAEHGWAPEWNDVTAPYRVVKAVVYLESDDAAMAMMAGSHASPRPIDRAQVRAMERRRWHRVIGDDEEPNRRFTPNERRVPFVWAARAGDVLIVDERLYHCGRRVERGTVVRKGPAPTLTVSLVFGADNDHSARMYSYVRFVRRELDYRSLPEDVRAELRRQGVALSSGGRNYYADHPEELDHVH